MKHWKTVNMIVYPTQDEITRVEYGGYVIQIYPYPTYCESPEFRMCHTIIGNENGCDAVVELDCLLKCIKRIDGWNKRGIKK